MSIDCLLHQDWFKITAAGTKQNASQSLTIYRQTFTNTIWKSTTIIHKKDGFLNMGSFNLQSRACNRLQKSIVNKTEKPTQYYCSLFLHSSLNNSCRGQSIPVRKAWEGYHNIGTCSHKTKPPAQKGQDQIYHAGSNTMSGGECRLRLLEVKSARRDVLGPKQANNHWSINAGLH